MYTQHIATPYIKYVNTRKHTFMHALYPIHKHTKIHIHLFVYASNTSIAGLNGAQLHRIHDVTVILQVVLPPHSHLDDHVSYRIEK